MRRYIFSILAVLLLHVSGFAQSHGLTFNSHEVVLEKRTSLDLSSGDSLCLAKKFELGFDINFIPGHQIYFGYIVRVISNDNQNIDLIFNQRSASFNVIIGENFSGISFRIDSLQLYKQWNKVSFQFDLESHMLHVGVNGKIAGSSSMPAIGNCFRFLLGANDFQKFTTRDIPPMQIRDIRIFEGGKVKYFWPLDETSGDTSYDRVNRQIATVKNAVWIRPKYQKWELLSSFTINGYAGVAYDAKHDKLYVAGSDSLGVYMFNNDQNGLEWTPSRHQDMLLGHQAIYNAIDDQLCDISIDQKKVAFYDFNNRQWDPAFPYGPITEFWHANKFISAADSSLYIIGGYGQLRYKNRVERYHFATRKWDSIAPGGDYFPPRYLSALGTDPDGNFAYILGGYGSMTGDQELDPRDYYDLFRYNIKERSFKKIYTFKPLTTQFTFANSLVLGPDPGKYYGLIFPHDSFNSNLQLIEGSLTDSTTFRALGNTIPYNFHDVQSFADLYYSPLRNKLIAVTLFYSKEEEKNKTTSVKIYSLNFHPEPTDTLQSTAEVKQSRHFFLFFLLGGIAGIAIFVFFRRRVLIKRSVSSKVEAGEQASSVVKDDLRHTAGIAWEAPAERSNRASIYLFGPFQVFDKEGNDITKLFTPLLKELFLIICIYTIRDDRGISSEGLNEILWHDKSEKDAKNNRSVNIAKLKTILEKVGNCSINKEPGHWQFQIMDDDPAIYVDYRKYVSLLPGASDPDKGYIHPLVEIVKRGAFLFQTEYDWLDNIKSEISNSVIDLCLAFVRSQDIPKDPEFIIEITNCIFYFDQLNEDALTYKCKNLILLKRHTLANNVYVKFIKEYKDMYGTEFGKTFAEIIV